MYNEEEDGTEQVLLGMRPLSWARAIWKQKACLALVWLVGTAAAALIVYNLPLIYKSGALILVEGQRIPKDFVSPTVDTALAEQLGALKEQVLSYSRLLEIIRQYNLYVAGRRSRAEEQVVEKMRGDISIDLEKSEATSQLNAFRVSYQGSDPRVVAAVAKQLSDLFVQENLRLRQSQANGTAEFLASQLAEAKQRLEQQEAKLSEYKLRHNGQLPEQETALLAKLNQFQVQLQGVEDRTSRAQQSRILLEASLKSVQESLVTLTALASRNADGPAVGQPSKVEQLEVKLAALEQQYTSDHPDVIRAREMLADARARERDAETSNDHTRQVNEPTRSKIPAELAQEIAHERERITQLHAEEAVLKQQIVDYEGERQRIVAAMGAAQASVDQLPAREQDMASILRDYQTSKANYQSLLDKKLAAEMAGDMEKHQKAERFAILEPARVPEVPFKPKRPVLFGGGCFAALLLGGIVAAVRERRQDVFLGEWELPPDVAILARVPELKIRTADAASTAATG